MNRPTAGADPIAERLPPFNVEAEQGVLGSIVLDNDSLHEIVPVLRVSHFFRDAHQIIYRAILRLYEASKPIDWLILEDELQRAGELDKIGGSDALHEIINGVPHAAHGRYYAQVVRETSIQRDVIAAANEILSAGYSNAFTASDLIGISERRILAIGDAESPETRTIEAITVDALERFASRKQGQGFGLLTGLTDLDNITTGFRGGDLVVIAARPSMGKTAFALQIMAEVGVLSATPTPVYFASLEMDSAPIADRLLVSIGRVDAHTFRVADPDKLTRFDERRINEAAYKLSGSPLVIDDGATKTIDQIVAAARRMKARNGLGLIVVDYLQLIAEGASRGRSDSNRQEHIARISRSLKILARDLDVPVVILSQLNRGVESRENHRPRMSDIRESGAVENDADLILMLYRPEYYDPTDNPGTVEVIVAKQRNGAVGTVFLTFLKHIGRFESTSRAVEPGTEF